MSIASQQHWNPIKGGDPAAASATATLLRLRPSYRPRLRQLPPVRVSSLTLGVANFHDVTGGVYKTRERIQRAVLTHVY
jgi:hypothetical protein